MPAGQPTETEEARQPLLAGRASDENHNQAEAPSPLPIQPDTASPDTQAQGQGQDVQLRVGEPNQAQLPPSTVHQPPEHLLQPPAPAPALQAPPPSRYEGVFVGEPQGATVWGAPQPNMNAVDPETAAAYGLLAAAMSMPSVAAHWAILRPFLACWLVSSMVNLMIFMMFDMTTTTFLFAEIAAIIGLVAGGRSIIPACREGVDLLTLMKQLHVMAALATFMDLFTLLYVDIILLTAAFDCPDDELSQDQCSVAKPAAAFFTFVLGSHAILAMHSARGAFQITHMLNPVTSGLLPLDH